MRRLTLPAALAGVAITTTLVWATTYHAITVDGDLGDFAADEKTASDPPDDSGYGPNNELTSLHVTWTAQKLYLGLAYAAEQTAVMLLVDTGKAGGATDLCPGSGYAGAFPSNLQASTGFDLMAAFYAPADHATAPAPYVYALTGTGSTDITAHAGVEAKLKETVATLGRTGAMEVGIPWSELFPGGMPAGATLKIAAVVRGNDDSDGLGDASPNPSGAIHNKKCGTGQATALDAFHVIKLDANGDGVPEPYWQPGPNAAKIDAGVPPDSKPWPDSKLWVDSKPWPDLKPAPDTKPWADSKPWPDSKPWVDSKPWPDLKPAPDTKPKADTKAAVADSKIVTAGDAKASQDRKLVGEAGVPLESGVTMDLLAGGEQPPARADSATKKIAASEGCACTTATGGIDLTMGMLLAIAFLWVVRRRRR